jgi:hypothetical protein
LARYVRVKITEEYAKEAGRDAHFWAWQLVNINNRRVAFSQLKEAGNSEPPDPIASAKGEKRVGNCHLPARQSVDLVPNRDRQRAGASMRSVFGDHPSVG